MTIIAGFSPIAQPGDLPISAVTTTDLTTQTRDVIMEIYSAVCSGDRTPGWAGIGGQHYGRRNVL